MGRDFLNGLGSDNMGRPRAVACHIPCALFFYSMHQSSSTEPSVVDQMVSGYSFCPGEGSLMMRVLRRFFLDET